jgi:uncharacterized membrane protein
VSKTRLETFSDGVIAILITIMVLELRPPDVSAVAPYHELKRAFPAYLLSFVVLAIYWNNHHHMLQLCTRVNGKIMWANMHLLFWLSLVPLGTAWISDPHGLTSVAAAAYAVIAFMAGISWLVLKTTIVAEQGPDSPLQAAYGSDWKGRASGFLTLAAIPLAFVHPYITIAIQVIVVLMWIIPDRRIESRVAR